MKKGSHILYEQYVRDIPAVSPAWSRQHVSLATWRESCMSSRFQEEGDAVVARRARIQLDTGFVLLGTAVGNGGLLRKAA